MKVLLTFYKRDDKGEVMYNNSKPITDTRIAELPLKFGYGSYNEPRKVLNQHINADDLLSIDLYSEI